MTSGGTTRQSTPLASGSWNPVGIDFTRNQKLCSGWAANRDEFCLLLWTSSQPGYRTRGTFANSDLTIGSNKTRALHQNKGDQGSGVVGIGRKNEADSIVRGVKLAIRRPDISLANHNPPPENTSIRRGSWAD